MSNAGVIAYLLMGLGGEAVVAHVEVSDHGTDLDVRLGGFALVAV